MVQIETNKECISSEEDRCNAIKGTELLFSTETRGTLSLTISLYSIPLGRDVFFAVFSRDADSVAAEMIGTDRSSAESVYRRIARGSVPPSTLHEVIFDLL